MRYDLNLLPVFIALIEERSVTRADHPEIENTLSREQYEQMRHVNIQPPGRLRAGLFQALERQGLRRELAISVTHSWNLSGADCLARAISQRPCTPMVSAIAGGRGSGCG
ncbi:hypothetical protein ACSFE6_17170 [Pseudomonas baetica]|uniref:hypothetical protein n=1 Tax=Pseudomonas baetica TaxID=674054 RepID=UPI003EEF6523